MTVQENTPRACSQSDAILNQIGLNADLWSEYTPILIAMTRLTAHLTTGLSVLPKSKTWASKLSGSTMTMPHPAGRSASASPSRLLYLPTSSSQMAERNDVSPARGRRHQPCKHEGQNSEKSAKDLRSYWISNHISPVFIYWKNKCTDACVKNTLSRRIKTFN